VGRIKIDFAFKHSRGGVSGELIGDERIGGEGGVDEKQDRHREGDEANPKFEI
jgi:hypothetical protein